MKKLFVLLILLLSFGRSQAADIEARTGILGGDGWGLQMGASDGGVYKLSTITVVFYTNGIVAAYRREFVFIWR